MTITLHERRTTPPWPRNQPNLGQRRVSVTETPAGRWLSAPVPQLPAASRALLSFGVHRGS